jgi:hypothetical protein
MPTLVTVEIEKVVATMATVKSPTKTKNISAFDKTNPFEEKFTKTQLNLHWKPAATTTKLVPVPSFRRKNGTLVAAHTRQVKINNNKPPKPDLKKKAAKKAAKFVARDDCKESVSLAYSLMIEEKQKLLHPERYV